VLCGQEIGVPHVIRISLFIVRSDAKEYAMGREFFEQLYEDDEFSAALGRLTMSLDRFESNLRAFLKTSGAKTVDGRATIRELIPRLKAHGFVTDNGVKVLNAVEFGADYLTHRLFDLFSERIDETALPRTDLVPADTILYAERARDAGYELDELSKIVEKRLRSGATSPFGKGGLLFSP
jgi:hypothetical protein